MRQATRRQAIRGLAIRGLGGLILAASPLAAPLGTALAAWRSPFPPSGEAVFDAWLGEPEEGRRIGRQLYRFARRDGLFSVEVEATFEVAPADDGLEQSGPFNHRSLEEWRDGWLSLLVSDTRIGTARHRLRAVREGEALRGHRDDLAFTAAGYLIPSSLWHPDTPLVPGLIDSIGGRVRLVRGRDLGTENLRIADATRTTRHYRLLGELRRELWYDEDGRLVRAALPLAGGGVGGGAVILARR